VSSSFYSDDAIKPLLMRIKPFPLLFKPIFAEIKPIYQIIKPFKNPHVLSVYYQQKL